MEDRGTRSISTLRERVGWVLPVWLLGVGLFAWGVFSYESYHMSVYKQASNRSGLINEYRINLASKYYSPKSLHVKVEGLPPEYIQLSDEKVYFESADRIDSVLHIKGKLEPGIYPLLITSTSEDGWKETARVQHVVPKG